MNDSASVTSTSLAVAEKTPPRNGGCVGILFQLFDWNRRLSKKKLFSKRLLPPDRAKEGLKKFGGDDKLPKLRLIADENSGGFPNKNKTCANELQTPNLVARLMGLESMPSVHGANLQKDDPDDFTDARREKVVGEFRPQKLQKTGMVDTKSVTRFGSEALQLKHVLSQSKKYQHPKLVSPVKNTNHHPQRNASRLIKAASRILEPGLRARNTSKYAISYGQGACASRPLINGLRSKPVGQDASRPQNGLRSEPASQGSSRPLRSGLRSKPVKCEDLDLVSGQASCRNCGNLIDIAESRYDQAHEFTTDKLKFNCFPLGSDAKDFVALNKSLSGRAQSRVRGRSEDMKFDTRDKFGSARVNSAAPRQRRQGQIGNKNSDDEMTFRFNSPMKNDPNSSVCKPNSRKRFTSNQSDEKIRVQKPFPLTVAGYESVFEASFSNDNCCSSSLEDSSVHADSMSYSYDDESQFQEPETDPFDSSGPLRNEKIHNKLVADLLTYITQVLCNIDLVNSRTKGNIKEIIFNSELVLSNQLSHNPNEMNSFFICDLLLKLDTLADAMWARFGNFLGPQNSKAGYQLKCFVFDSLIEYLESKYVRYSKCGFRAWMNLPRFMGFDHLIREVVGEVRRWMCVSLGEVHVEMDTSHGSGKWVDFEIEVYETGGEVEWDIVEMLIDELVVDVSTPIGGFQV